MRVSLVIDGDLTRKVMNATGLSLERAVEEGLHLLIKVNEQQGIRRLKGKVAWQGNPNRMRESRVKEWK